MLGGSGDLVSAHRRFRPVCHLELMRLLISRRYFYTLESHISDSSFKNKVCQGNKYAFIYGY